MTARRRELGAGAALALLGVLGWALVRTYPNYDSYFALVWGRELAHGVRPSYRAFAAPTPHPLWNLVGALCSLLGRDGERAIVLVAVLALVALVWGVARLGTAAFGLPVGLLAALFVGTSFGFLLYAAKGYVDVPFIALVTWAGALEQERPRRGWPVMLLLALAGLLRPEAWLLAVAYWMWLGRGRRGWTVGLLVVAAPLLWAASDLAVTGDPLFSLHSTSATVVALGRDIPAREVPSALVSFLAGTVRPPVLALGVAGVALAVWRRGARALVVPLALLLAGILTFVANALLGLSAQQRYLTVPAMATCLFAAYALVGFVDLAPRDRRRAWWARASVVVVVAGAAVGVALLPGAFSRLRSELRFVRATHDDLVALLDDPRVGRCRPIVFPTYRLVPDTRWLLDLPEGAAAAAPVASGRPGVRFYVSGGDKPIRRYGLAAGVPFSTNAPDLRLPVVARRGPFTVRGGCPPGGAG